MADTWRGSQLQEEEDGVPEQGTLNGVAHLFAKALKKMRTE
jgi:hypothetical protein